MGWIGLDFIVDLNFWEKSSDFGAFVDQTSLQGNLQII